MLASPRYFSFLHRSARCCGSCGAIGGLLTPNPGARLVGEILTARYQLAFAGLGFALVGFEMALIGWLKAMIPFSVGFWADPMLADLDRAVIGRDAWLALSWAPRAAIDLSYSSWFPAKFLAYALLLASFPSDKKSRAVLACFLTWGIGALAQYLLPSAGPIFYEKLGLGDRFSEVPFGPLTERSANYVWANYQAGGLEIGGGISAMPSMHVAIAVWVALVVTSYIPKLKWAGAAFASLIWLGSVYLGWHYASDGLVGGLIALLAWKLAGLSISRAPVGELAPAPA